jgi:[ribosomal protein S18]-alanine N-acetyltransferase
VRFTVRDYRQEDFDTLWAIDQSCFPPGISYSQYELRSYLRRPDAFTLVAESAAEPTQEPEPRGPEILGFLVAESSRRVGHIITIDVRSEARRHRIGSALLDIAESRLSAANCRLVRLETAVDNVSALAFYKRRGFDVIKTIPRYYSNHVDALLLEKDLRSTVSSS